MACCNKQWDLDNIMLDETQVYEAQTEDGATIEIHYTRTAAQEVCDQYTKQFNEPTRVAVSWIYDRPESIAQRYANDKINKEHLEWN